MISVHIVQLHGLSSFPRGSIMVVVPLKAAKKLTLPLLLALPPATVPEP